MTKPKIWQWILNAILIGLLILGIYLFLDRIFGNSPTDFQLILWLLGFFGAGMVKGVSLIYNLNKEMGEIKIKSFHAFKKIRSDVNNIKGDISEIKELFVKKKR